MAKSKKPPVSPPPAVHITEFEVNDSGTLRMADYIEAETRAEFYGYPAGYWSRSRKDLAKAMDECIPLAWAVHSIYWEFRNEVEDRLNDASGAGAGHERTVTALKARLKALPEEPEEGATDWLLSLTTNEFKDRVVPEIKKWFGEPPDWSFEDDHLPEWGTAQGAALEFFRHMDADDRDALGVVVVEGEHPASTYYAAELRGDIDEANLAAEAAGIPVRFVSAN